MPSISSTTSAAPGRVEQVSTQGALALGRAAESAGRPADSAVAETQAGPLRRGDDRVEFSDLSRYLSKVKELPDVRTDLVTRVRAELEAGTYESAEKLELAIDGLSAEIDELS